MKPKKKYESTGSGCMIQGIGLILLFLFPIGTPFGILLLFWGGLNSYKWICPACNNFVAGKTIMLCPACGERFE